MQAQKPPANKGKGVAGNFIIPDDSLIHDIEKDLLLNLTTIFQTPLDAIIYDTTNYFTNYAIMNPSERARFAKRKDGKQNKQCVGWALGQTLTGDLPLFHLINSANCNDSKIFPATLDRLSECLTQLSRITRGTILVMDKGNISPSNIQTAAQKHGFSVVGSLVPAHFPNLCKKPQKNFSETAKGLPAFREERTIFGLPGVVVMTFNETLRKRQEQRLEKRIRVFIFSFILVGLHWRLIMLKQKRAGFPLSDRLLRMELSGIRELVRMYSAKEIDQRFSEYSEFRGISFQSRA